MVRDFRLALLVSGGGTTAEAIVKECRADGRLSHITHACVIASKSGIGAIKKMKNAGISGADIVVIEPKQFTSAEEFGSAILKELEKRDITLVGQFGWMVKTPKNVIERFKGFIINQHPGPLDIGRPDFGGKGMYGLRVHAARLMFIRKTNHDFWSEATSQRVAEEFDKGAVLKRKKVEILPHDTPESLQARMLPIEHETQIETLEDFMNDRVAELTRDEPLVRSNEVPILEEAKKAAIAAYPMADTGKNVLVIGSGGREYALAWKLSQSPKIKKLYIAPGNGGTSQVAENVPIQADDFPKLIAFAKEKNIYLIVVGPDDILAKGIVDAFQGIGILMFGPNKAAAGIESSKAFAKQLMKEEGIPTARFETFTDYQKALQYLDLQSLPIVIKASGLALGKGVVVAHTKREAEEALKNMMVDHTFGEAGNVAVIEEFLEGREISIHAFCDGASFKMMPTSQDHKTIGEGDTGLNTGGMGTIAPVPWATRELQKIIENKIMRKTLDGLRKRGMLFSGCLYPGLKITPQGPKVLEFNARFGDPETQSLMRLLKTDLFDIVEACALGKLNKLSIEWHTGFAVCVVIASGGYPGSYEKGFPISGFENAERIPGVIVFHAGTKMQGNECVTSGGRVLGVSAIGDTLEGALEKAYQGVGAISFKNMYYRKDIGANALTYE